MINNVIVKSYYMVHFKSRRISYGSNYIEYNFKPHIKKSLYTSGF